MMGWVQHGKRVSPWTRRVLKSQVRGLPRALGRPSALPSKRCLVRGAQSLIRRPPCALARSQRSKVKAFGVRSGSSPLLLAFAPRLCSPEAGRSRWQNTSRNPSPRTIIVPGCFVKHYALRGSDPSPTHQPRTSLLLWLPHCLRISRLRHPHCLAPHQMRSIFTKNLSDVYTAV